MLSKIKDWWFRITHVKCDYCKKPVEVYYDAWMFPVDEYKGPSICMPCVKNIKDQKNIVYIK